MKRPTLHGISRGLPLGGASSRSRQKTEQGVCVKERAPALPRPGRRYERRRESVKVLIINGSPRKGGNCERLLGEVTAVFDKEGVEYEILSLAGKSVRGCAACGYCATHEGCVFRDEANLAAEKLREADGLVVASPVYYASANGSVISLLDRAFYSGRVDCRMKVGAAFAVARRAGTSATFDELNKYFTINQMPVASGRYWNDGFGREAGQIEGDEEGLQNARVVARNMVFLMKSIALGKEKFGLPETEETTFTHFIR